MYKKKTNSLVCKSIQMLKSEKPRVFLGTKRSYPEEKSVMSPEKQRRENDSQEMTFEDVNTQIEELLARSAKVYDKFVY